MKSSIERKFDELLGKPCWNARKMYASNISFDFGLPYLTVVEPKEGAERPYRSITVEGDWRIWINCCHWRLLSENVMLAHDESSDLTIVRALGQVNGEALTSVKVDRKIGTSEFHFEFGKILKTFPYKHLDWEGKPHISWIVFFPGDISLTYRADGKYTYGTEAAGERWL